MSLYTNDTDTLRQLICPVHEPVYFLHFTIVAVFFCMLYISVWLTLVVLVSLFFILKAVELVVKKNRQILCGPADDAGRAWTAMWRK